MKKEMAHRGTLVRNSLARVTMTDLLCVDIKQNYFHLGRFARIPARLLTTDH